MDKGKKKVKFTKSLSSTKPFWAFTKLTPENQQRFKPKGETVYLFQSKRNEGITKTRGSGLGGRLFPRPLVCSNWVIGKQKND